MRVLFIESRIVVDTLSGSFYKYEYGEQNGHS